MHLEKEKKKKDNDDDDEDKDEDGEVKEEKVETEEPTRKVRSRFEEGVAFECNGSSGHFDDVFRVFV